MKSQVLRRVSAAVLLAAVCAPAFAGPGWGGGGYYGGRHGYYGSGYNHHHHGGGGSSSDGWWIGGAIALAAVGALLLANNANEPAYNSVGGQVSAGGVTYTTPPGVYDSGYGNAGYGGTYVAPYESQGSYAQPLTSSPTYAAPQSYPVPQYDAGDPAARNTAPLAAQPSTSVARNTPPASVDCRSYAINQSGYDPSIRSSWTTQVMVDTYNRYLQSCMAGS
ncbi:hypothetical protein [Bordetella genomosp. 1]|uniref:Lipoprotein n=1 Tax=Bordetella genomosp. 1 TaxID=1395607 RepID=A0ABX4EVX0_9BORD|nr:hypothetical protein [Bordetella genomosp. 1]OZI58625.1 hypothetical protein CAL27_18225 [Bordetella genomosp. 1]